MKKLVVCLITLVTALSVGVPSAFAGRPTASPADSGISKPSEGKSVLNLTLGGGPAQPGFGFRTYVQPHVLESNNGISLPGLGGTSLNLIVADGQNPIQVTSRTFVQPHVLEK